MDDGINNGAGLDVGPIVGTDDGPGLAESLGFGTGDGSGSDEGPVDCAGLRNRPSYGTFT